MRHDQQKQVRADQEVRELRKRIEESDALNAKLRTSEERLRVLFEHAPDAMYLSNLEGTFLDGNAAVEALTGYARDELIGKSFLKLDLLMPEDLVRAAALLAENAAGRSTGPDEFVLNRKDGSQIPAEIRAHPVTIGGQPMILGIARDITPRRQTEDRLRLLSLVAEQSPISIGIVNSQGIIEYANSKLLEIYGTPLEGVLGKRWTDFVSSSSGLTGHAEDLRSVVLDQRGTWRTDIQDKDKDGNLVWRRATAFPVIAEQGEITHIVYMSEEATARILAEEALRASESQYATLVETTTDGIVILQDGIVRFANTASVQQLGYAPDELIGTSFMQHVADEMRALAVQRYTDRISGKEAPGFYELELLRKDSTVLPVEVNASGFTYQGRPAVLAFLRDVTERKQAEDDLRESEERYRTLVEQSLMGIGVSRGNEIVFANAALLHIFGYDTLAEFARVPLLDHVAPSSRALIEDLMAKRREGETGISNFEYDILRRDDTIRTLHAVASPFTVDGVICAQTTFEDITERKQAEHERFEALSRFSGFATANQYGMGMADLGGNIVYVNPTLVHMLGEKSADDCLGQHFQTVYYPEEMSRRLREEVMPVLMEKGHWHGELELLTADGRQIPTDEDYFLIRGEDGQPRYVADILTDITERKHAEEELRASEAQLSNALRMAHAGHWEYDVQSDTFTFNDNFYRIFRTTAEEVGGYTMSSAEYARRFCHPDDIHMVSEETQAAIETDDPYYGRELEHRILFANGDVGHIAVRLFVVKDSQGRTVKTYGVNQDITERKRVVDALRQKDQEIRDIVESSRDWIWSLDLDGRHTFSNPAVEDILGYVPSEIVGQSSLDLLHPEDRTTVEARLPKWIESRQGWRGLVLRWRRKDGNYRYLESNSVPVLDASGELVGFRGVDRDITERLEAEQRIRSALEGTIQAVAETSETRDPYTAGHQKRVTDLAVAIAQHLNLPDDQVEGIRVAATLHDIGKMSIPAEILSKPGKLSEHEILLIREHPKVAHAILKGIASPWPVAEIVLQHHERLDGTGYPRGLEGENILLEARIITVADTVEAMSSHRPYRPALGMEEALREIEQNKGTLYDPDAVTACVALFETGKFSLDS